MTTANGNWLPPIPWDVLRAKCFTPVQGRVLFALWSRCDADGNCWPGLPTLREDCGCDERTVKTAVAILEQHGVITITKAVGQAHRYHLDPDTILQFVQTHDTPLKNVGGTKVTPPKTVGTTPRKSVGGTPLNFVGTPPSKMRGEEEPVEVEPIQEEPVKKSQVPSLTLPSVASETGAPAKRERAKKEKADETLVTQVRKQIEGLQGYAFSTPAAENTAIKKMLDTDGAQPDDIVGCWKVLREQPWRTGFLRMWTVRDNLGEFRAGRLTADSRPRAGPTTTYQPRPSPQPKEEQAHAGGSGQFARYGRRFEPPAGGP